MGRVHTKNGIANKNPMIKMGKKNTQINISIAIKNIYIFTPYYLYTLKCIVVF